MEIPEESPKPMSPRLLTEFYGDLAKKLALSGIQGFLTGGQACIHYSLTQFSKDSDWIIPNKNQQELLEVLDKMAYPRGSRPKYTRKYGAPFDPKWSSHGWSSHFYFPEGNQIGARLDIFTRPPRVDSPYGIKNWPAVDKHTVACMKKTQRDKDWPFVHLLGHMLCKEGNPKGLLHLQNVKTLMEETPKLLTPEILKSRPLLGLVSKSDTERLDVAVTAEQVFWKTADRIRLETFLKAWEPYGKMLKGISLAGSLLEQTEKLVEVANKYLPEDPLSELGEDPNEAIRAQASEKTLRMFAQISPTLLPLSPVA